MLLHARCARRYARWLRLTRLLPHSALPHAPFHAPLVRPTRDSFAGSRSGLSVLGRHHGSRLGSARPGPAGFLPSGNRVGPAEGVYRKCHHERQAGSQQRDSHCAAPLGRTPRGLHQVAPSQPLLCRGLSWPLLLVQPRKLLLFGIDPMNRASAHHAAFSERGASATEGLSGELPGPRPPLRAWVSPGGRGCDLSPAPLGTRL
jgi:hypothetical protein